MSKTSAQETLLRIIGEINRKSAKSEEKPKWTVHRVNDAKQMIAYAVHPDIIYKDIKKEFSPFRIEHDQRGGPLRSDAEFRQIAEDISKNMYIRYKRKLRNKLGFKNVLSVNFNNLPPKLLRGSIEPIGGYDDNKKIIYYNAGTKSKNHFESFQSAIKRPVETIIKSLPDTNNAKQYLSPSANYKGIAVGHTLGPSSTLAEGLIANPEEVRQEGIDKLELIDFEGFEKEAVKVKEYLTDIISNDADLEIERDFNPRNPITRISLVVPESAFHNAKEGGSVGKPSRDLQIILRKMGVDLFNMGSSPSHIDLLSDVIEQLFLTGKAKTTKSRTKAKLKGPKVSLRTSVYEVRGATVKGQRNKEKKNTTPNLQNLIALLNSEFHDKIRENMGKGNSKQKLNYQTGRFAKSAKVQALLPSNEKGAIEAQVKYMRDPYGTFEKGGRLHKTLRDPKGIFGRSIRQILQENKIANLRRVKVRF